MEPHQGLYDPRYEHDACGVGFVANIDGTKSHEIVVRGIRVLENLLHRGATGGDEKTGDGAGILVQIPDDYLQRECSALSLKLPPAGKYGVGMLFLPRDQSFAGQCRSAFELVVREEGLHFLGWREVPVDSSALGAKAREEQPLIVQCFISDVQDDPVIMERKLYVIRKLAERRIKENLHPGDKFYIPSLSCRTIVYKGLLLGTQLGEFYADLNAPDFISAVAVIHQRYSTNTFPSWKLAQPFRYLAHNGEINTLRGNIRHMQSREKLLGSHRLNGAIEKLLPIIDAEGSDSGCMDNALELLVAGGRDIPHAMMMLIPQAWGPKYPMGPDLRGFFEYNSGLMEPWDGPAAVAFTDGSLTGALLDRNGLRPCRYTITKNGFMVLASETGVLDFAPDEIAEKGALRPGEMILVNFNKRRVLKDKEIKNDYARRLPYRRWVEENKIMLHGLFNDVAPVVPDTARLLLHQKLFGYTREDLEIMIRVMASKAHEPIGSMGCDTPLAVMSEKPQLLYAYFKQLFAQVTNPPIDPIREELVMSLMTFMGNPANILVESPQHSRLIKLRHPILSNEDLGRIKELNLKDFTIATLPIGFPAAGVAAAAGAAEALENAINQLCRETQAAINVGRSVIILSDRDLPADMIPIPALLAVSAVNQAVVRMGKRTGAALILETGEPREVHHFALLLGYGATAINPYLAFDIVADMAGKELLEGRIGITQALENYIHAVCKGLLKVMSKMGISTLRSYRSAQVFEAIGLSAVLIERYFPGTASRIQGIGIAEIAAEAQARHATAYGRASNMPRFLPSGGRYRYRKDGERHLWTPESITKLQCATRDNDFRLYREYARLINDQTKQVSTLRGMFKFKERHAIPLEEVEPVGAIMKRFVTSAMSFGSISREAHETLAIAMNRIGAMSNSGEGGEDPGRYEPLPNGDNRCSAVKQIASGRFGVTTEYLVHAKELQIKMAQGAKPGEGGQLPGFKVDPEIARVRHTTPGVTLISPPPHHDIYSIEDIKQLVFDLKNVNPTAEVSVKLVSEVGVGTIAAGVAKGGADKVLISGHDGGTGASPLSSIHFTGAPWELGLAETQQALMLNNLRGRIRLQVDGQLKTGRDVIIAALLGAEEFGFATAPLVVCGCVMMRKCNENICPVGIATQNPELRKRFAGKPEYVVNFFTMIAEEVREYMARLGFRRLEDLVGHTDMLEVNDAIEFWKARHLDFLAIFCRVGGDSAQRCMETQPCELSGVMDEKLIELAKPALEKCEAVVIKMPIRNVNRAVGTMLSGEIARRYGGTGLPDDTIACRFKGSAGQSFGAFGAKGLTLRLEGDANDYLGKGLSGARIVVVPPPETSFDPSANTICGNVLLYGATGGEAYFYGCVGERFAIRNSGAYAVVEGVGDHACEYMTGGRVVVLGRTGVNFAAGMSGGIAYVYDPEGSFDSRCNLEMVDLDMLADSADIKELRTMIQNHFAYTGSRKAEYILAHWQESLSLFVQVFPTEYRRALGRMSKEDEAAEREGMIDG
ncbi:MAG: glutamate synthase large subunit [Verrucomicrobia bacterium]|nr:glutamate synthase large subunit [Verrucomicrobiota bacterium]MBU1734509.1 glutamate synthase large subunit [Verrucomicrobiota bacterium]MBU1855378.1 glutamate synthase large subunit [Verrucomicrobiota bacterium]